jgi:hypothetical protein
MMRTEECQRETSGRILTVGILAVDVVDCWRKVRGALRVEYRKVVSALWALAPYQSRLRIRGG